MVAWFSIRGVHRGLGCLLLASGLVWLAGCGTPTGQVTGTVTWKQKPVAGAELVFEAVNKPEDQFFGLAADNGVYQVSYRTYKGLPIGRYKITVTRYSLPDGRPVPEGEKGAVLKSQDKLVKSVFTFEKDIGSGANQIDLELTAGGTKGKGP